ncbi:MAG: Rossmann fold domain-containing protein [Pseudomonadota bacterium]
MAQAEYLVTDLPDGALEASAAFYDQHLQAVRTAAAGGDLVIVLPPADYDHTDWRRALARDLARACAPGRVNVIAAGDTDQKAALLQYLAGAKGVTGHYCQTHE